MLAHLPTLAFVLGISAYVSDTLVDVLHLVFVPVVCKVLLEYSLLAAKPTGSTRAIDPICKMGEILNAASDSFDSLSLWSPVVVHSRKKMVLALDLDETLIHCTSARRLRRHRQKQRKPDAKLELYCDGHLKQYDLYRRPYLDLFLQTISQMFEIVIFTSGAKAYADPLINYIDRQGNIRRRFYRDSCIKKDKYYLKDLAAIVKHDLARVLIVDNCSSGGWLNPENIIPITSYYGYLTTEAGDQDQELLQLIPFLMALESVQDVRSILSRRRKPAALRI